MVDFADDLLTASLLAPDPWYYGYGYGRSNDADARLRAKNIEDNFGAKAEDITDYRKGKGGHGILKALVIGAACLAATAVIGGLIFGTGGIFGAIVAGSIIGSIVSAISMSSHEKKIRNGYSQYLDDISAQARQASGRGQAPQMEYDNGTPGKSYVADLSAQRQRRPLVGAGQNL